GARREPRCQMAARSSLLRRQTPGARPARRTSSVVAALAALAPRLVRLAHHDYPDRLLGRDRRMPPSTLNVPPVIQLACGEARKTTSPATSAGSPMRPAGIGRLRSVSASTSSTVLPVAAALARAASSTASVRMRPGTMQFERIPSFEKALARLFVKLMSAALAAA